MIDEDLVTELKADATIAAITNVVAVGLVPVNADGEPLVNHYIWISQFDEEDLLDMDAGPSGATAFRFDLECVSSSISRAKQMAQAVKRLIQGYNAYATFGDGVLIAGYIESKDDDYVPVNRFDEANLTVVALGLKLWANDTINDS